MAISFGKDMTTITNERHRLANAATASGASRDSSGKWHPAPAAGDGGLQVNTDDLALELNARRISTAVLTRLSLKDRFGLRSFFLAGLAPHAVVRDSSLGYDVFRSRCPWGELDGLVVPEVVVVQNGRMLDIAAHFARRGVPTVAYFHGLEFETSIPPWPRDEICRFALSSPTPASLPNAPSAGSAFAQPSYPRFSGPSGTV